MSSLAQKSAREIRHSYIQQYLGKFLRKVHPDLFLSHPKEQLRNSAALQDLLPLVGHNKHKDKHSLPRAAVSSTSDSVAAKKLVFYYKPGPGHASPQQPTAVSPSQAMSSGSEVGSTTLRSVEHMLPVVDASIPSVDTAPMDAQQHALEQEIKSWQMVQSFLDLCRKVEVPVKIQDQESVATHLKQSVRDAAMLQSKQQRNGSVPQKPLSEIFAEELQTSYSGSTGTWTPRLHRAAASTEAQEDINQAHLGKMGGSAPLLDAQLMIKSNPLLFKSPTLSTAKLNKLVRTWIHWQHEDRHIEECLPNGSIEMEKAFRLGKWWRKVPVMILSSGEERAELLRTRVGRSNGQSVQGMLVVDQEMSKQGNVAQS
ncbi:hypothetical protein BGZ70_008828 [Mortierella alpina]|uniref:DUF4460 domain-containing protein n=1 Tax=Mortierella alpina TaxID=64518 RepID=A0A9P6J2J1_MORAP|nr:hypothetical protein BGZ70_008828 [Mortierella alpina]